MLKLSLLEDLYAVIRMDPSTNIHDVKVVDGDFFSITKTNEELSIVCLESKAPAGTKIEKGWRCFKVEGPLDFSLTGILYSLAKPLAESKISIFAISTFDTDYLLIRKENLHKAIEALSTVCKVLL